MKKMGILASLALSVTIGGVYAAWNYAENDVAPAYAVSLLGVTGVEGRTTKGTLKAEGGAGATFSIDDTADGIVHNAKLVPAENGKFVVTFVANANSDVSVREEGITLQWHVGLATADNKPVKDYRDVKFEYDVDGDGTVEDNEKQQLFSEIKSDPILIDKTGGERTPNPADGTVTFVYEVELATILNYVTLNEITLHTEDMHNQYSAFVSGYVLHFHVEEAPEAQTPVVEEE